MLATARRHLPQLHALLMDRATFDAHAERAVAEPVSASEALPGNLHPHEAALAQHLRTLEKGRLEQEFLPVAAVVAAVQGWANLF